MEWINTIEAQYLTGEDDGGNPIVDEDAYDRLQDELLASNELELWKSQSQ